MSESNRSISGVLFLLLSSSGCVIEIIGDGIGDEVDDTGDSSSSSSSTSEESTSDETDSTSEESTSEESSSSSEESTSEESTSEESSSTSEESTSEESTSEESTSEESTSSSEDATETEDTFDTFDTFFIPEGDLPNGACDPFAQDCPDGEKCVAYASQGATWDANKCVPVLGDQELGEACVSDGLIEATDDCDANGFCFFEICTGFCAGSPDEPMCPDGFGCVVANESINACMQQCDPLLQDCSVGQGCYFASDQFLCLTTNGDVPIGEPCGFLNDCAAGSTCIDASVLPDCADEACCSPFCDLQGADQCAAIPGTACGEFTPDVGVCLLP